MKEQTVMLVRTAYVAAVAMAVAMAVAAAAAADVCMLSSRWAWRASPANQPASQPLIDLTRRNAVVV